MQCNTLCKGWARIIALEGTLHVCTKSCKPNRHTAGREAAVPCHPINKGPSCTCKTAHNLTHLARMAAHSSQEHAAQATAVRKTCPVPLHTQNRSQHPLSAIPGRQARQSSSLLQPPIELDTVTHTHAMAASLSKVEAAPVTFHVRSRQASYSPQNLKHAGICWMVQHVSKDKGMMYLSTLSAPELNCRLLTT